jgi:hypothetical protein
MSPLWKPLAAPFNPFESFGSQNSVTTPKELGNKLYPGAPAGSTPSNLLDITRELTNSLGSSSTPAKGLNIKFDQFTGRPSSVGVSLVPTNGNEAFAMPKMEPRGTQVPSGPIGPAAQPPAPIEAPTTQGAGAEQGEGFWNSFRGIVGSPGFARLLATLSGSISARDPSSWQNALSKSLVDMTSGRQAQMLMGQMSGGPQMSRLDQFGMTPTEYSNVFNELRLRHEQDLADKKLGLEERNVVTDEGKLALDQKLAAEGTIPKLQADTTKTTKEGNILPGSYEEAHKGEMELASAMRNVRYWSDKSDSVEEMGVPANWFGKFTNESIQNFVVNKASTGAPDFNILKPVGPDAIKLSDTDRDAMVEGLKNKLPKSGWWIFSGDKKISELKDMLDDGKVPADQVPYVKAYIVLKNRQDETAKDDPARLQDVYDTLNAVGIKLGAGAEPVAPTSAGKKKLW